LRYATRRTKKVRKKRPGRSAQDDRGPGLRDETRQSSRGFLQATHTKENFKRGHSGEGTGEYKNVRAGRGSRPAPMSEGQNSEAPTHEDLRRWREPKVKRHTAALPGRRHPGLGTPEWRGAPGHPPMMIGKPRWNVTMVSIPHPLTSLSATPFTLLAYFLPRP